MGFSRNTEKRKKKEARDRALIDERNKVDPTTRMVDDRLDLDGTTAMRGDLALKSAAKPPGNADAAPTGWVENGLAGKSGSNHGHGLSDLSGVASSGHGHSGYANDNHSHSGYAGSGHDHTINFSLSGSSRHSHSISSTTFIKLSKTERRRMLVDRLLNRHVMDDPLLDDAIRIVARNTENQLSLLMDYRELDAFERERRFDDPEWAEWTESYKQVYGVDDYAEDDRTNFLDYGPVRMDPYEGIAPVKEN